MNAHAEYVKVSNKAMQQDLLLTVTPPDSDTPDQNLIKLYADTSSSPSISQTFLDLQVQTLETTAISTSKFSSPQKRYTGQTCDNKHQAARSSCDSLVRGLRGNFSNRSGSPRSICLEGCCVSWSEYASFEYDNLVNAAALCLSYCSGDYVSCKVYGVELKGTILNQCLSNRPTGC